MSNWLSDLFKSGPVFKHWWRESADRTYRIVAGESGKPGTTVAVISFTEDMPLQSQHAALARIVKGLDN